MSMENCLALIKIHTMATFYRNRYYHVSLAVLVLTTYTSQKYSKDILRQYSHGI